ncbi:MAG: PEP-CTERM sorting domain-containing protein [Planctomycetes bacterium]|nr:PEP-CTERM sorting domain-containing protein [Planctomycetota bacterium]
MRQNNVKLAAAMACCGMFLVPSVTKAELFKNVLIGLSEAGFNFVGQENLLSGGADLIVTRTFNGERLDFGATEIVLTGSPTFTVTTGGRGLEVLDVSLNTGNNPLNYVLTTDTGNQQTTVTGSFFLDATASINSFGFYDLQIDVSSRQTIEQDGVFDDSMREEDFDIGPINLRGNIFADLLATVTDPIFDLLGIDNIFAQFSGAAQFEQQLAAQTAAALATAGVGDTILAKARNGEDLTADEIAYIGSLSSTTLDPSSLGFQDINDETFVGPIDNGGIAPLTLVPEPTTLLLIGLAIPTILRRRR